MLVRCCSESCTRPADPSLEPPFAVWLVGCVRALPLVPCSLGSVFALPLVPCSLGSVRALPLVPCSLGSVCAVPLRFSWGCVCAPFVPCSLGWLRSAPLVPLSPPFWPDSLCAEDLPFGSLCCAPFSD